MGSPALFSGNFVKFLKDKLNLFDKAYILTGTQDPRVVATDAPKGSLMMRQTAVGVGQVFKKDDNGSTTNWRLMPGSNEIGTANEIKETLKNQLVDSPYELVTPNITALTGAAGWATLTGATYDVATNTISFAANGNQALSINQLDAVEFIARGLDVTAVDLSLFWNQGASFTIPTGFTYEVSRDGGTNWFPITMTRVGTTEVFRGPLTFDTSTTTESVQQSLQTVAGGTQTDLDLNATTSQQIGQSFVVPAGQTWVIKQLLLTLTKTGTPAGNVFLSIYSNNAGVPSSTVLAQSNAIVASSLVTGSNTITLPTTVLPAGTYHFALSSDAAYKAGFSGANKLQAKESNIATGESSYNGTVWAVVSGKALVSTLQGRSLDLRLRITAAGSPVYPVGLDGYGLFYNNVNPGVVSGNVKKSQRFTFNSVTDNLSSFAITAFQPDVDLLTCWYIQAGQGFKVPAFSLNGTTAVFPTNTFNNGGVSATVTLVFEQNDGSSYDSADANARLLASNHLGQLGIDDRSIAGRGPILRRADGVLVELGVDSLNNITISSVP